MFISSNKKRSIQTAKLINEKIAKINPKIKTRISIDGRLDSLDEGGIVLPDNYEIGDHYLGFEIASKIFIEEAHATDYGKEKDNVDYRYGDPIKLPGGDYKYPELLNYFSSPGESYSDYLLRIYGLVLDSIEKSSKFGKKVKIVIVTHAQTFQIFKSLLFILNQIKAGELPPPERGNLALMCWKDFLERRKKKTAATEWNVGSTNLLDIEPEILKDPLISQIIKQEIQYLKGK